MRTAKPNRWSGMLGYALAIVVFIFALRYAAVNAEDFASALRKISHGAASLALGLFLLQIALNAFAFAYLNEALGVTGRRYELARIWSATLLAKYVPGGLWHVIGRGVVLARLGVPAKTTALVGAIEQSISLLLCALIAVVAFVMTQSRVSVLIWSGSVVFLGVCIVLVVYAARRFVDARAMSRSLMLYATAMIPYALGYFFLIAPSDPTRMLVALFAGTVAGVAAVPVPGGLGIRESVASMLSADTDGPRILVSFLAARGMILAAEIIASALTAVVLREKA